MKITLLFFNLRNETENIPMRSNHRPTPPSKEIKHDPVYINSKYQTLYGAMSSVLFFMTSSWRHYALPCACRRATSSALSWVLCLSPLSFYMFAKWVEFSEISNIFSSFYWILLVSCIAWKYFALLGTVSFGSTSPTTKTLRHNRGERELSKLSWKLSFKQW